MAGEFLGPPANVKPSLLIQVHLSVQENAFPFRRTWTDWLEISFGSRVCPGSDIRQQLQTALAGGLGFRGEVQSAARDRKIRAVYTVSLFLSLSVLKRKNRLPNL